MRTSTWFSGAEAEQRGEDVPFVLVQGVSQPVKNSPRKSTAPKEFHHAKAGTKHYTRGVHNDTTADDKQGKNNKKSRKWRNIRSLANKKKDSLRHLLSVFPGPARRLSRPSTAHNIQARRLCWQAGAAADGADLD